MFIKKYLLLILATMVFILAMMFFVFGREDLYSSQIYSGHTSDGVANSTLIDAAVEFIKNNPREVYRSSGKISEEDYNSYAKEVLEYIVDRPPVYVDTDKVKWVTCSSSELDRATTSCEKKRITIIVELNLEMEADRITWETVLIPSINVFP